MKIKITYWWLCACLCVNSLSKAASHKSVADSLFASGQYQEAAIEYEKEIFICKNDSVKNYFLLSKAICQKLLGNVNSEERTLSRVDMQRCSDSLACAVFYEKALCNYLLANFKKANDLLERAFSLPVATRESNACLLLHGFVLNELYLYPQAATKFGEYFKDRPELEKGKAISILDSMYTEKKIPKLKSLKKARRMSLILPGSGLFYARKPGRAITNITLLLAAATYTGYNVFITNYFTAATSGFYFMRYFYTGGVNQLNEEIPKYNYKKTRTFNDAVKHKLTAILL